MQYALWALLLLCFYVFCLRPTGSTAQPSAVIAASDPDFSLVLFPDTQYYYGANAYVLQDQVNWVVSHQSSLNIKAVIGLGDIVDGGGYPIDGAGNVIGTCVHAPPSNWQTQWQQAKSSISILNSKGIYYLPTIGNHDYDCENDRPQPRSSSNYFHYFANLSLKPTAYILDSGGNRTPNFYKIVQIGSTNYMVLSLEFLPRGWVVNAANNLISNFAGPIIVVTHAYLSNDGSGPTFSAGFPAGSAFPLCSGFPSSIYGCLNDSFNTYKPVGGGTDGIGLWYSLIGAHPNVFLAVSGHVRLPTPGNYPSVPNYNGTGRVDCNVQSWTTLCSTPYRPIQILSDFQGQGNNGYFGYGYLRILTVSPVHKTVTVFTYSPSITNSPAKFPAGIPAYKTDVHNQYTLNFPNTFGGPDKEVTHITAPHDGSHVALQFPISADVHGPDATRLMQIYVDGAKQSEYYASALPAGATVTLSGAGMHRVAVQAYDSTKAVWAKSVIYVTNP